MTGTPQSVDEVRGVGPQHAALATLLAELLDKVEALVATRKVEAENVWHEPTAGEIRAALAGVGDRQNPRERVRDRSRSRTRTRTRTRDPNPD